MRDILPPPRPWVLLLAALLALPSPGAAQEPGGFSVAVTPLCTIPVGASAQDFVLGGGALATAEYGFPAAPFLGVGLDVGYRLIRTPGEQNASIVSAAVEGGLRGTLSPRFSVEATAAAGWYLLLYMGEPGYAPAVAGRAGFSLNLTPAFRLGLGASFEYFVGAYTGVGVGITASIRPGAGARKSRVEVRRIELLPVYPVFRKYYDTNPLGSIELRNRESGTASDITVRLMVKQYMDSPKVCGVVPALKRQEEVSIPLYALFNDEILGITEQTLVSAEITVEYTIEGQTLSSVQSESLRVLDRNALSWDDDNKAAAFVTPRDPMVLLLSKSVASAVREAGSAALDENLRMAMGMFQALGLYGVSYVADPKTPYADLSQSSGSIDFLQFPQQTLTFRAGDCDDLSVLFAALMESIGVETAFITVPGHIYAALALKAPQDARQSLASVDDLIDRDGALWLPVEITLVGQSFLRAWSEGAKEWREAAATGAAGFFPVHRAWSTYEAVGIKGPELDPGFPTRESITGAYSLERERLVQRELEPQVRALRAKIGQGPGDFRTLNRLGALYARYGMYDEALTEFRKALAAGESYAVLLNVGNVHLLRGSMKDAADFYARAERQKPDDVLALTGLARAQFELGDLRSAQDYLARVQKTDPSVASRYAYIAGTSSGDRAAEARPQVEWVDSPESLGAATPKQ